MQGLGLSNNFQCLLYAVCAASDSTGITHCFQKFFLILPGVFPGKFDLNVDGTTVRATMTHNVAFAMLTHTDQTAVLGVKLSDRVVPSYAAVLTESYDNPVL